MKTSSCIALLLMAFVGVSLAAGLPLAAAHAKGRASCPVDGGYDDGCVQAHSGGNFINPDFFTYGKQSGQGQYFSAPANPSDHPPPWNVAGVDYAVGYFSPVKKLQDPAGTALPNGCSFSPNGSYNHGAIVICANINNLNLDRWDFSLHDCTVLDIKSTVSGTITIRNSKFVNGSNCSAKNGALVMVENSAAASFKFEYNFVDGRAPQFPTSLIGMIVPFVSGKMVIKYNAFLHSPGRPITSGDIAPLLIKYNYFEGWVYQISDGHGEVFINYLGDNKTQKSITYSFNTGLETNDVCACGTAVWYPTAGGANTSIGAAQVDHNTSIVNKNNGQLTVAAASAETAYNTYGSVTFQENYMDPTGSLECFITTSNPTYVTQPVFVGNINMIDGKTVVDYGNCP